MRAMPDGGPAGGANVLLASPDFSETEARHDPDAAPPPPWGRMGGGVGATLWWLSSPTPALPARGRVLIERVELSVSERKSP